MFSHAKHKAKEIELIGIGINTLVETSASSLYGFLKCEGVYNIPVGVDKSYQEKLRHARYQSRLSAYSEKSNDNAEDSVRLYRRLLAGAEGKVEIIEVGFLQVIARALLSGPDDISELSGMELFEKKVDHVWIMGGKWSEQGGKEYNFCEFPTSVWGSSQFVNNCPVPITFLGWEIGANVITGDELRKTDVLHEALKDHGSENGRESWDPMLTLLAITGDCEKAGYEAVHIVPQISSQTGANYYEIKEGAKDRFVKKKHPDEYYIRRINDIIN